MSNESSRYASPFQLFVLVKVFSFHLSRGWVGANLPVDIPLTI